MAGRPTKYKEEYAEQTYKLCLLGATDKELADFFDVNEDTINEWKKVFPKFSESIKRGKKIADANVADRLYQRALGYEHDEVELKVVSLGSAPGGGSLGSEVQKIDVIKHYPPEPTAAIFWLKNRQPEKWRDKQQTEITGKDGEPLPAAQVNIYIPDNGRDK
jgi:hypothetical protein